MKASIAYLATMSLLGQLLWRLIISIKIVINNLRRLGWWRGGGLYKEDYEELLIKL
jgi:hypothetical protein